jgi:hypothetical protein
VKITFPKNLYAKNAKKPPKIVKINGKNLIGKAKK